MSQYILVLLQEERNRLQPEKDLYLTEKTKFQGNCTFLLSWFGVLDLSTLDLFKWPSFVVVLVFIVVVVDPLTAR